MHRSTLLCLKNSHLFAKGPLNKGPICLKVVCLAKTLSSTLERDHCHHQQKHLTTISPFLFFFDPTDRVFIRSPGEGHIQFRGCFPFLVLPVYDIWFPF